MDKAKSKYYNTAVKMDKAFLQLLNEKDFPFITVKEICKRAGVNRSTFYLHYETVNDLLEETMDYINGKFNSYFKGVTFNAEKISALPLSQLYLITPEYLTPWLQFIQEDKRLFQTFLTKHETLRLSSSYKSIFEDIISPILTRFQVEKENQEYVFLFYVEGIIAIVKKWIREGCVRSVEEITALITACIQSYES